MSQNDLVQKMTYIIHVWLSDLYIIFLTIVLDKMFLANQNMFL